MADDPDLVKFLEIAQKRIENQHSVLWKVETHYTWFVYIIAGAVGYLFLKEPHEFSRLAIPILSLLGLALSLIGYYVVRLEGEYLHENHQIYHRTLAKLPHLQWLHSEKESEIQEWSEVKKKANKCFGLLLASVILNLILMPVYILLCRRASGWISDRLLKCRLTVRDAFQITLLLAGLLFILFILLSIYPQLKSVILSILPTLEN